MKNTFLLNWTSDNSKFGTKISNYHLQGGNAKFMLNRNIEVFMVISYKTIAVACSGDDCTFTRTWKEDPITEDEIKIEIDNFLEECEKKLK